MGTGYLRQFAKALKIVLVGDAGVGKSWLLLRAHDLYDQCSLDEGLRLIFDRKAFEPPETYSPTDLKTCVVNVETPVLGNYQTRVCDTGGRAFYDSIRPLAYNGAQVFMLCFDVTNRQSFRSITQRWLPEIQRYQPSAPVLIVGTKSDLRTHSCDPNNTVPLTEALSIAKKVNSLYLETSAKSGDHVDKTFECAVQLGHMARKKPVKQVWWRSNPSECADSLFIPSASPSPAVAVDASTFAKDFATILSDSTYADVVFSFEDGSPCVTAHKIVLCLSPSVFKDVFQDQSAAERFIELFEIRQSCDDPLCKDRTCIVVKSWISWQTFNKVLKFLYTGIPDISKDSDENEIKGLLMAAEKLEIDSLVAHCNYVLQLLTGKTGKLSRPSHGTRELPGPAHSVQDVFLNKLASLFSDVSFLVDGKLIFAHRAIVAGRSAWLAALFSDNYIDGKASEICLHGVDCAAFLAVMEYLYTDNCSSLSEVPVEDVLIVADRLCLSRLVQMCEVRMRDEFQQMAQTQNCKELLENLLDILDFSTIFNAYQLKKWCLHFMATNHTAFETTALKKELELVVSQNMLFFEQHRWPPESCVTSLRNFKRKSALIARCKPRGCSPYKCSVM